MKSKIVNAVAALMNFLFGVTVLCYSFIAPNATRATENELIIMNQINTFTIIAIVAVTIIDFILLIANRQNKIFAFSYAISILSASYYIFNVNIIAILYLLSALLICLQVLRENIIEKNSTIFLIILSIAIAGILMLALYSLTYQDAVEELDAKDNIGQTEYSEDFFEYVTELDISDVYINVEQNDKWGYINQNRRNSDRF